MKLITAEEALQALKEYKRVEYKFSSPSSYWKPLDENNSIGVLLNKNKDIQFQLVQEMITIGNVSFPKPETKPLPLNAKYWTPDITLKEFACVSPCIWENDDLDERYLSRGLIHLTEENAIAHAKALIKLSGGSA